MHFLDNLALKCNQRPRMRLQATALSAAPQLSLRILAVIHCEPESKASAVHRQRHEARYNSQVLSRQCRSSRCCWLTWQGSGARC